jgi:hypothetical protein
MSKTSMPAGRLADGVDLLVTVDPLHADPRPLLPQDAAVRVLARCGA